MLNSPAAHPTPFTQSVPVIPSHVAPHLPGPALTQTQERQALRNTHRSAHAHNPVRGQQVQSNEGGKGHTRGAANYHPREIEILLNLAEDELPVGAKGWSTIGAKFWEWAAKTQYPARTDRSLELKYKQVCLYTYWYGIF